MGALQDLNRQITILTARIESYKGNTGSLQYCALVKARNALLQEIEDVYHSRQVA